MAQITRHGLYADIRGDQDAPALLFLHGGPGQGCHDFMALQGDLLAKSVRLIGLDQRGVDRSAPLPDGATLTIADLVDDCESVRAELGIDRWAVAGQSFGGGLALRLDAASSGDHRGPGRLRVTPWPAAAAGRPRAADHRRLRPADQR